MARTKELPEHVSEFVDLSKQYVRERTLEPAKALGRLAGMGFAAAAVFVLAALFLGIAGTRALVDLMPDGNVWEGLGYVAGSIGLLAVTGLIMWRATR
ncbi:MAG: hypothetical protein R3290_05520 [Acidimicrobiia bacterium]|nr:hypothetical protein [Acidimicrobiia bacterium]